MKIFLNPPATPRGAPADWTKRFETIFTDRNFSVTYRLDDHWDASLFINGSTHIEQAVEMNKPVGYRVANGYLPEWFQITGQSMKPTHHAVNASIALGMQHASVVIYQSSWAKQMLDQSLAVRNGPHQVIFNGVDLRLFSPQKTQHPELPVLGTVGALRYRYRLETFLEVSCRLGLPHRILIVGSLDQACKKVLSSYSKIPEIQNRLEWVDFVPHSHLPGLYNQMSLLIHPVMGDACPNVVCEALACGLAVVAPQFGGTAEVIGDGGIVFPSSPWIYDDRFISQMTDTVRLALRQLDPLKQAARQQAIRELDIETMADRYLLALGLPTRIEKIYLGVQKPKATIRTKASRYISPVRYYGSMAIRKTRQLQYIARPRQVNKIPKIAFTLFDFQIGGIENWLFRLASELRQHFIFYFISTRQPVFLEKFRRIGNCIYLPSPLAMARYFQNEHIDLVQVHNERWPVDAALSAGVPKVIERLGGQRSWRRISKKGLDFVIASSKLAGNSILDMIAPEKIRVIYNGIDLPEIETSEIRRVFPPEQMVLGRASRFGRGQNLSLLIQATEKLHSDWPDLRLVLVGGDSTLPGAEPLFSELNQMVDHLRLEKFIHFTGSVENPIPFIKGFDIGTCVSNDEGLPNSLIEAMACKKAVVSSNVGAISELIEDGANGLLFPAGDTNAFCTKVEILLSQPDLRRKLAENAYQTIHDHFNIQNSAMLYGDLYRELLGR